MGAYTNFLLEKAPNPTNIFCKKNNIEYDTYDLLSITCPGSLI